MLVENICILMILLATIFVFFRTHHKKYALATSPLLILPFCHAAVCLISEFVFIKDLNNILSIADIVALAISVAIIGLLGGMFKTKKTKAAYILLCGGYTMILCFIFLFNNYSS